MKETTVLHVEMPIPNELNEVAIAHENDPRMTNAVKDIVGTFLSFLEKLKKEDYEKTSDNDDESQEEDNGFYMFTPYGVICMKLNTIRLIYLKNY